MSKSKKNKAVALKYNVEEDTSPVVIASGYGTVAEKIIDIAEKKGIPVFKDDSAASLLCMLEVGSNIPVELYEVVAAIYCRLLEASADIKSAEAVTGAEKGEIKERNLLKSRVASRTRSARGLEAPDQKTGDKRNDKKNSIEKSSIEKSSAEKSSAGKSSLEKSNLEKSNAGKSNAEKSSRER